MHTHSQIFCHVLSGQRGIAIADSNSTLRDVGTHLRADLATIRRFEGLCVRVHARVRACVRKCAAVRVRVIGCECTRVDVCTCVCAYCECVPCVYACMFLCLRVCAVHVIVFVFVRFLMFVCS